MNSLYFAIGCVLIVLVVFWGSLDPEPQKLTALFGWRAPKSPNSEKPAKKRVRW